LLIIAKGFAGVTQECANVKRFAEGRKKSLKENFKPKNIGARF
jgi:hypothetical protein